MVVPLFKKYSTQASQIVTANSFSKTWDWANNKYLFLSENIQLWEAYKIFLHYNLWEIVACRLQELITVWCRFQMQKPPGEEVYPKKPIDCDLPRFKNHDNLGKSNLLLYACGTHTRGSHTKPRSENLFVQGRQSIYSGISLKGSIDSLK